MRSLVALSAIAFAAVAPALAAPGSGPSHAPAAASAAPSAAAKYDVAPMPAWVDELPLGAPNPAREYDTQGGRYFLLLDDQVQATNTLVTHFNRWAVKIVSSAGLESAGRVDASFNPAFETLHFHRVRVWRDGKARDVTNDIEFKTAQREEELDSGITDGRITVFGEVHGLRVGDVVDVETSWQERFEPWPGTLSYQFDRLWTEPLARQRVRLLADPALPVAISDPVGGKPVTRTLGKELERVWDVTDPEPQKWLDHVPVTVNRFNTLRFARTMGWGDVASWALKYYKVDDDIGPDGKEAVADAKAKAADVDGQITELIRFVQNDIRYVGREEGLGGFVPRAPSKVLAQRFGDCKDKALLLASLLRAIGVEAYPALTDLNAGRALTQALPSPWAFDHVVVQIVRDGKTYWIDATNSQQGGRFPAMAGLNVGFALPLRAETKDLAVVERPAPGWSRSEDTYDFTKIKDGVGLVVETTYHGRAADNYRDYLTGNGARAVSQKFLDYYHKMYPGIAPEKPLAVKDDFDADELVLRETYRLPRENLDAKLADDFPFETDMLEDTLPEVEAQRDAPLGMAPARYEHVVRMKAEPGYFQPLSDVKLERPYLRFTRTGKTEAAGVVSMTYVLDLTADAVPTDQLTAYAAARKKISDYFTGSFNLSDLLVSGAVKK